MPEQRKCAVCGRDLLWSQRRDAKFCNAQCRQRNFRRRQRIPQLPPEVRRVQVDITELMPARWKFSDVVFIEYSSPVLCFRCRVQGTKALGLFLRASRQVTSGVPAVFHAVFCSEDCLLDTVCDRRFAGS